MTSCLLKFAFASACAVIFLLQAVDAAAAAPKKPLAFDALDAAERLENSRREDDVMLLQLGHVKMRPEASPAVSVDDDGRKQKHVDSVAGYRYSPSGLYGLAANVSSRRDGFFQLRPATAEGGGCALAVANVTQRQGIDGFSSNEGGWMAVSPTPALSYFAFGECPKIIQPTKRWRLDLGSSEVGGPSRSQPGVADFASAGWNPSMTRLPESLRSSFPNGRWLCVVRIGSEQWHLTDIGILGILGSGIGHNSVQQNAMWASVLDADFGVLARAQVHMRSTDSDSFLDSIFGDPRILLQKNEDIVLSFTPYTLENHQQDFPLPPNSEGAWWHQELVARMHVAATASGEFEAWVNLVETQHISECPSIGLHSPGAHKNLGFFQSPDGDVTYALNWVRPTRVGEIHLGSSASQGQATTSPGALPVAPGAVFAPLCFGDWPAPPQILPQHSNSTPWGFEDGEALSPSNGPGPIWIEELQQYVGVSHFHRGYGDWAFGTEMFTWGNTLFGHHYTQQFFAFSGAPPFQVVAVSPEFCFASLQDSADCETIQFVTSLNLEGEALFVGYGVNDIESHVAQLDLSEVLRSLRPLS